jgi:uncharacterized protein (TIRG00374 family)
LPRRSAIPALFFLLGLGLFAWLVASFGVATILARIAASGGGILAAILIWFVIYVLNTAAWRLALGRNGAAVGAVELFMITVSGFVINYITPVVALGGEPYKAGALSARLGPQGAIPAVVLYRMVHLLGHMSLLLAGIVLAFLTVPLGPALSAGLAASGVCVGLVIAVTLNGTRRGLFDRLAKAAAKRRFLGFLSKPLSKYGDELAGMDRVLTDVYHNDRRSFVTSVALEFLARTMMGLEVFVVLRSLGTDVTLPAALTIYVLYSIVINVLFFVPMNVGAREGGILLGMEGLAADPVTGMSVGIILRIREFAWIAVGLLFIVLLPRIQGRGRTEAGARGTP